MLRRGRADRDGRTMGGAATDDGTRSSGRPRPSPAGCTQDWGNAFRCRLTSWAVSRPGRRARCAPDARLDGHAGRRRPTTAYPYTHVSAIISSSCGCSLARPHRSHVALGTADRGHPASLHAGGAGSACAAYPVTPLWTSSCAQSGTTPVGATWAATPHARTTWAARLRKAILVIALLTPRRTEWDSYIRSCTRCAANAASPKPASFSI